MAKKKKQPALPPVSQPETILSVPEINPVKAEIVTPLDNGPQYGGRGIVIIALGDPNYGKMAANLASSIRFADPNVNIHLVYSGNSISHLTQQHKALFTSMAECPAEYYTKNDKTVYLKAKTCIYELSPFAETLMLDADMLWFSDETKKGAYTIFETLKDVELTFENRGYFDLSKEVLNENYSNWCNISEVKEKYNATGRFYHLHSEFIFFKRSESNKAFFALVREIFDNPKVKPAAFDGDIPDELAFDIAVCISGKHPHKDNFVPIYWFAMDGRNISLRDIHKQYFGLSMGGNLLPAAIKTKYEVTARFYAKHFSLPYAFNIQSKKRWSAGRVTI